MSMNSVQFVARWSRSIWIVTAAVLVLVTGAEFLLARAALRASDNVAIEALLVVAALLPAGLLIAASLFAPTGYTIRPDAVVVRRRGPALVIVRERICRIERLDSRDMGFVWRVFGVGGFLGWFGLFYSRSLGEFRAYATNRRDLILITEADGRKTIVSPFPPETFAQLLQEPPQNSA